MLSDHLQTERSAQPSHLDTQMGLKRKYHTHVANWYPVISSAVCRKKKALPSVDQVMTSAAYAVMAYVKYMVTAYISYLTHRLLHTKTHSYMDQHQSLPMFRNLFSLSHTVSEFIRPHQSQIKHDERPTQDPTQNQSTK